MVVRSCQAMGDEGKNSQISEETPSEISSKNKLYNGETNEETIAISHNKNGIIKSSEATLDIETSPDKSITTPSRGNKILSAISAAKENFEEKPTVRFSSSIAEPTNDSGVLLNKSKTPQAIIESLRNNKIIEQNQ